MKSTSALRKQAEDAIRRLFNDTTISRQETIAELEALKDEIDVMIDSIDPNAGMYPGH